LTKSCERKIKRVKLVRLTIVDLTSFFVGVEVVCFVIVEVVCLQLREKIVCFVLIRSRLRVVERKRCGTRKILKYLS